MYSIVTKEYVPCYLSVLIIFLIIGRFKTTQLIIEYSIFKITHIDYYQLN